MMIYGQYVRPYIGWDLGRIYGTLDTQDRHFLSGVVIGIKGGEKFFYSLSLSMPLIRPRSWKGDHAVVYGETGIYF